jgi:predicted NAD/FAD-binding protein
MNERRTRRAFLKTGSAAALGASIALRARGAGAQGKPRVGIVGGGLAGVSCAWLLDGVANTVLFESRFGVGGHAETIPVKVGNQIIGVDVGAQFFADGTHPHYTKLLEVIGLQNATVDAEMTITVTQGTTTTPLFVSPASNRTWPILAQWNSAALAAFFAFAVAAKQFSEDGDWLVPLGDWLEALPVAPAQRDGLLLPLLAALTGCTVPQALTLSARSAIFFIGKALPANLLGLRYKNSVLGLGGNVKVLAQKCHDLTLRLGSPVSAIQPTPTGFQIRNAAGAAEDVDVLIFANPPFRARPLLPDLTDLAQAATTLQAFEYFPAAIDIHRDPAYMQTHPAYWSAYNADISNGRCEGSVWYGALRPVAPGAQPLSLFKSWATERSQPPANLLLRQPFLHPLITPAFIETGRQLASLQGRAGVWFAGSYTGEVDSQETALTSAMNVVRSLDPQAPNLLQLGG